MEDRFMAGAISGMTGSVAQLIYGIVVKRIGLTDRSFYDFARVVMMYTNYPGFLAAVVGAIAELIIGALVGISFSYLLKHASSKYYYAKGLMLSAFFWLLFGVSGTIFRIPLFTDIPPNSALTTFGGALLLGLCMSLTFSLLNRQRKA